MRETLIGARYHSAFTRRYGAVTTAATAMQTYGIGWNERIVADCKSTSTRAPQ